MYLTNFVKMPQKLAAGRPRTPERSVRARTATTIAEYSPRISHLARRVTLLTDKREPAAAGI